VLLPLLLTLLLTLLTPMLQGCPPHLDGPVLVHQQVWALQVAVDDPALVQVQHAAGRIHRHAQAAPPRQRCC